MASPNAINSAQHKLHAYSALVATEGLKLEKISCCDPGNRWLDASTLVGKEVDFEQHFPTCGEFEAQTIHFSALVAGFSIGIPQSSIPGRLFLFHSSCESIDPADISSLTVLSVK